MAMIYYPAPAKINRFLRIVRQEADGYHALQTLFQFTDLYDEIGFKVLTDSDSLHFHYPHDHFTREEDLIYQAIMLLQPYNNAQYGLEIDLIKRLPMGGGLGGGSSNAATALMAINQLWELNLPYSTLLALGRELGADVPIFIHGESCWAEGRGDHFMALTPAPKEEPILLIIPPLSISTAKIFTSPHLARNNPPLTPQEDNHSRINDCLSAIYAHYPLMKEYMEQLEALELSPQITGTGSTIFIEQWRVDEEKQSRLQRLADKYQWQRISCQTRNRNLLHPHLSL